MSTGSKSPYEIRLELLQMARDHLEANYKANLLLAQRTFEAACAANKARLDQWAQYAPTMYTTEQIMAKAAELYAFVSRK